MNRSSFTRGKGPWALIGFKVYNNRSEGMAEEYRLKQLKNRERLLAEFGFHINELALLNKEVWAILMRGTNWTFTVTKT